MDRKVKQEQKPYYRTKAEIVLLEDVQDFRQDGMTEEEIIKTFTATLWSLL